MMERLKTSIATLVNAMHITHNAATQADRVLHLQPGRSRFVYPTSQQRRWLGKHSSRAVTSIKWSLVLGKFMTEQV